MKKISLAIVFMLSSLSISLPSLATTEPSKETIEKISKQVSKVNLNTAGAKEIADTLKGVGMVKAQAIVAYRNEHGDFKSLDELVQVKGIGVATVAKNEDVISF